MSKISITREDLLNTWKIALSLVKKPEEPEVWSERVLLSRQENKNAKTPENKYKYTQYEISATKKNWNQSELFKNKDRHFTRIKTIERLIGRGAHLSSSVEMNSHGERHGKFVLYDDQGSPLSITTYDNGKMLETKLAGDVSEEEVAHVNLTLGAPMKVSKSPSSGTGVQPSIVSW